MKRPRKNSDRNTAPGLHYLSLDRSTTSISVGELQRLRLATQLKSNLFGVIFVMDEPSSDLHPRDVEGLIHALHNITETGNSLLVVEHNPYVIKGANWVVDVGPRAGVNGGELVYSGPVKELASIKGSPNGRTPRSTLATYTGIFDQIRSLFASTEEAKARG